MCLIPENYFMFGLLDSSTAESAILRLWHTWNRTDTIISGARAAVQPYRLAYIILLLPAFAWRQCNGFDVLNPDTSTRSCVTIHVALSTRKTICSFVISTRINGTGRLADVTRRASDRFLSFVFRLHSRAVCRAWCEFNRLSDLYCK